MIGIDPDLLAWRKWQNMLLLMLGLGVGMVHLGIVRGGGKTVWNTAIGAIRQIGARSLSRQLCREQLVGSQLPIRVVVHRALRHLRRVGGWVGDSMGQIRMFARIHLYQTEPTRRLVQE